MKNPTNTFLAACLLCVFTASASFAQNASPTRVDFDGHLKYLGLISKSPVSDEGFTGHINRLRLNWSVRNDPWQAVVTLDNELILSDFSDQPEFQSVRSIEQNYTSGIDGDAVSVDNSDMYLRHAIYRAYLKYYTPGLQASLGKQAIDWGTMRFYSPLDVFNPIGPVTLERDQRLGVDAALLNISAESGDNVTLVSGLNENDDFIGGFKWGTSLHTYDVNFIAGALNKTYFTGTSFDGYIGPAGWRGEIAFFNPPGERKYSRIGMGVDYRFTDKWYVLAEHLYNGGHENNMSPTTFVDYNVFKEHLSFNPHLSSIFLEYTASPLVRLTLSVIYDWEDASHVVNPEIIYNVRSDMDVRAGVQLFNGDANSEFGESENLYYLELKWFF